jgi:hypothetical protein
MKDITYRCNLCKASLSDPSLLDIFLIGLHWTDNPIHGWIKKPARETETHICKTCLDSLQNIKIGDKK